MACWWSFCAGFFAALAALPPYSSHTTGVGLGLFVLCGGAALVESRL